MLMLLATVALFSCRKIVVDNNGTTIVNNNNNNGNNNAGQTITIKGDITKDTVLRSSNTYILSGLVYVKNNATITIEAGTVVKGSFSDPIGGLVITRGSKINAQGNVEKPIVFTSNSPNPRSGDWAGLVILGKASTNSSFNGTAGTGSVEGGINNAAGDGIYGAVNGVADDNDNSGVLSYVRIEYAGFAFLPDNEINSLTLAGVGRATQIDHVQVNYAKDDAIEWFGGTVNAKYLIAYKTQDDDFDTDNGFSGNVQFGLIVRDSSIADLSKSEAFESDNDANGSTLAPQTKAVFSNITALGPLATLSNNGSDLYLGAVQIRRNSSISIFNSAIMGWPVGLLIDASKGTPTDKNIADSVLRVQNNIIAGCKTAVKYSASSSAATGWNDASALSWYTAYNASGVLTNNSDAKLVNPFNSANFDPTPFGTSPLATGAKFTDSKLQGSFFTTVSYRGAVAPGGADANWWRGWTKFN